MLLSDYAIDAVIKFVLHFVVAVLIIPSIRRLLGSVNMFCADLRLVCLRFLTGENLKNPALLRENGAVIAGQDRVNGRQAARFHGL
jgi:hypothetical protein